jgi:death-on-curing family protein
VAKAEARVVQIEGGSGASEKVVEVVEKITEINLEDIKLLKKAHLTQNGINAHILSKVKGTYLQKPESVSKLSQELTEFHKILEPELGGHIISGSVESALHSAIYYETALEQSSAVFHGIVKNHTFLQGNKRTATEAFKRILQYNGLPCNIPQEKFIEIGLQIDSNALVEITEIAKAFAEAMNL